MAYYIVKIYGLDAVGFRNHVEPLHQILAAVNEHIPAVRHSDAVLVRTQTHSLRSLSQVSKSVGVDCLYLHIRLRNLVLRHEIRHRSIAPKVSACLVALVGVVSVVLRAYNQSLRSLAHCKIALNNLQSVDKRRASRSDSDCARVLHTVVPLRNMGGSAYSVVGRIGSRDNQVNLLHVVRQFLDGIVDGIDTHCVLVLALPCLGAGLDAGALTNPLVGQAVEFQKMAVGYSC